MCRSVGLQSMLRLVPWLLIRGIWGMVKSFGLSFSSSMIEDSISPISPFASGAVLPTRRVVISASPFCIAKLTLSMFREVTLM